MTTHSLEVLILQPWIQVGGAELVSAYLAKQLQAQGHKARIATVFIDESDFPVEAEGVSYILPPRWLRYLCSRYRIGFLLFGPIALFLVALRASGSTDVLNPHNFPSHWIAAAIGFLRQIPTVWTCNEPPAPISRKDISVLGFGDYLGWLLASSKLDRFFARRMTAVHVLSERVHKEVAERYGRDSTIISPGVNVDLFSSGSAARARSKYELNGSTVLLSVGKLHPQKNHIECLKALKEIRPILPKPKLLIVGEGPARHDLEQAAKELGVAESTVFLGRIPMLDLADLYAACDVNLFPATNQSWGLTPFEALCAGSISIVSEDSGAAELLDRIQAGVVEQPGARSFASAVLRISQHPEEYDEFIRTGRDYVLANLTNEQFASRLARMMLLSKHPSEMKKLGIQQISGNPR